MSQYIKLIQNKARIIRLLDTHTRRHTHMSICSCRHTHESMYKNSNNTLLLLTEI